MRKNPHKLADSLLELSHNYSVCSEELAKLTKAEGEYYKAERPHVKSDTAVLRQFMTTDEGIRMTVIKLKLKSIEKQISTTKAYLEVLANEARGLY